MGQGARVIRWETRERKGNCTFRLVKDNKEHYSNVRIVPGVCFNCGGPRFVVAVMHGSFGRGEARPSSVYTCSFASWRAMLRRGRMLERREPRHDGVLSSRGRQCDFQAPPWFCHLHGKPESLGMVGSTVDLDSILHRYKFP